VALTATNAAGTAGAESSPTAIVAAAQTPPPSPPPVSTVAPAIHGTAAAGATLTADPGTWSSTAAPTFAYQWRACDAAGANCHELAAATGAVYTATTLDVGTTLAVAVTATDANG